MVNGQAPSGSEKYEVKKFNVRKVLNILLNKGKGRLVKLPFPSYIHRTVNILNTSYPSKYHKNQM